MKRGDKKMEETVMDIAIAFVVGILIGCALMWQYADKEVDLNRMDDIMEDTDAFIEKLPVETYYKDRVDGPARNVSRLYWELRPMYGGLIQKHLSILCK